MAPEFASNVAHCGHIPVSIIRLRPRVKLSTRSRLHLLVGEVDIFDAAWWAEQQRLRFFESPMKEDADRDSSWACSNCTFQNAAGMWQCEMCSHHKPGESGTIQACWPLILATHYPPSIAANALHCTFIPTSRCRLRLRLRHWTVGGVEAESFANPILA